MNAIVTRRKMHTVTPMDIALPREPLITGFDQRFALLGSCFAAFLGEVLRGMSFDVYYERRVCNFFDVGSMVDILEMLAEGREPGREDLYFFQGDAIPWQYCFEFWARAEDDGARLLEVLRRDVQIMRRKLAECDFLLVTLGSSRYLAMRSKGRCMGRASGMPMYEYVSRRRTVSEMVELMRRLMAAVAAIRGGSLPVVFFTVSPQRYFFGPPTPGCEDINTYVDNVGCKSVLRAALDELLAGHEGRARLRYFPSYEIVLDELRQHESLSRNAAAVTEYTAHYVMDKFLNFFCSDNMAAQLASLEECKEKHWAVSHWDFDAVFLTSNQTRAHFYRTVLGILHRLGGQPPAGPLLGEIAAYGGLLGIACDASDQEALMRSLFGGKRLLVWGCSGQYAERYSRAVGLLRPHVAEIDIVDRDPAKAGLLVDGNRVASPDAAAGRAYDFLCIASVYRHEIMQEAAALGIRYACLL